MVLVNDCRSDVSPVTILIVWSTPSGRTSGSATVSCTASVRLVYFRVHTNRRDHRDDSSGMYGVVVRRH